jgi:hypothetical protein
VPAARPLAKETDFVLHHRLAAVRRPLVPGASRRGVLAAVASSLSGLAFLAPPERAAAARKRKRPKLRRAARCGIDGVDSNGFLFGAGKRFAQPFVAGRDGAVREVHIRIEKESDTVGNWVVQMVPVFEGVPAHEAAWVFAASPILDEDVPVGESTLVAKFAGVPILKDGVYAVVVGRLGGGAFNLLTVFDGPCPALNLHDARGATAFSPSLGDSALFEVYVV